MSLGERAHGVPEGGQTRTTYLVTSGCQLGDILVDSAFWTANLHSKNT